MAELQVEGDELVLTLSAVEKAESIHGDLRVPVSAVQDVEVVDDVIHAVHGLKFPGSRWPGLFAIGTFVQLKGNKTFAVVHHDTPRGVRVKLDGVAYDEIVFGSHDPEAVKSRLTGGSPAG